MCYNWAALFERCHMGQRSLPAVVICAASRKIANRLVAALSECSQGRPGISDRKLPFYTSRASHLVAQFLPVRMEHFCGLFSFSRVVFVGQLNHHVGDLLMESVLAHHMAWLNVADACGQSSDCQQDSLGRDKKV